MGREGAKTVKRNGAEPAKIAAPSLLNHQNRGTEMATKKVNTKAVTIEISPPNFGLVGVRIEGSAPLLISKFSEKSKKQIERTQTSENKTSKRREPKDYAAEMNAARYLSADGWDGLPCRAIRAAMIAACRTVSGLTMTAAKGAFFIVPQGRDHTEDAPLVKIHGKVMHDIRPARNSNGGTDMRNRPRYDNWWCEFDIQYDADMLSAQDVVNLLARAGMQVGLCELRPQSKMSTGGEYGLFLVRTQEAAQPKPRKLKAVA